MSLLLSRKNNQMRMIAVVWILLLLPTSVLSFSIAPRHHHNLVQKTTTTTRIQRRHRNRLYSSPLITKNSKSNKSFDDDKESKRLSKAKALLEEFLVDNNDQEDSPKSIINTKTTTKTPPPRRRSTSRNTVNANNSASSSTSSSRSARGMTTPPPQVPETFWSNGHLQPEADFVTRWAGGVKVAEPLVKYDPIMAEELLFRQPWKWMVRNVQIAFPIGWWAVGVVSDYIMGSSKHNRRTRAKQLLRGISGLGPAIIKGGQALASRSDLLPSEYLEELQKLQDDVPRFSNELAFATVEQELNATFGDVFELVQEEPVAAASIGQVYKAKLKANGDTVAIKIMRPKCEEIIALDLYILRWWSSNVYNRIFDALGRDIDVRAIIDDFGELIYREIDYVAEAANAQRFNELYASMATEVFVPKVYSDFTTSKVLTMEWVDGFRLTDSANLALFGLDRKKLVNTLTQCSLRQILENGFFHADPHGGNLLACKDGRLCYLDFGMMSYADRTQRNGFLLVVVHMVNRDWSAMARLYQKLGFIPEGTDLRPIETALEKALPDVLNSEVSEVNFKNVVSKLGDIMYTYPFSLPPYYISIIRCLGVLEGLAIQVDPQARIVSEAYPYVASRVLTDSQEDLQEALKRLALEPDTGMIRWERLEGLLEEAQTSQGYDVTAAADRLTDYLIANPSLLPQLASQFVSAADSLGSESLTYVLDAVRALASQDEVAIVTAFRALEAIFTNDIDDDKKNNNNNQNLLEEVLPDPTPSMKRIGHVFGLLNANNNNNNNNGSDANNMDVMKWIPILRKLANEPVIQQTLSEIVAQLGERALSRTLRAAFGLPPIQTTTKISKPTTTTMTEDVSVLKK